MRETKKYLKDRWNSEFKSVGDSVTALFRKKGNIAELKLPLTKDGLIDLRGYSAPKEYRTELSNSGRRKTYVNEGVRIKKVVFEDVDFSHSDFECCEFFNCGFRSSRFDQARFVATNFWGCEFENIEFVKSNFGYSTFRCDSIIFKRLKNNFKNVIFNNVNFTEVHFHDQRIMSCSFTDCKTGALIFSKCDLKNLKFFGATKDLFIKESRLVADVDFENSRLSGISLDKQTLKGFYFPQGDTYYLFENKSDQLKNLVLPDHMSEEQAKLVEEIKHIWLRNGLESDFVDVNWLNEDEMETGKALIGLLQKDDDTN